MNNKKKSILIVLVAGIGDLILASKSIRAIRKGFPEEDIHLLTSTEAACIASKYDYLDRIWTFPIRELRKSKSYVFKILRIVLDLRKIDFNMAINLYRVGSFLGALKMGIVFLLVKPQVRIGHSDKGFGLFLNKHVPKGAFKDCHVADAMMEIALLAGGISDEKGIEAYWEKKSEEKWHHLFSTRISEERQIKIGINPGGDRKNRRWDSENYAIVAERLMKRFRAKIFLLGGPGEANIVQHIEQRLEGNIINLAGKLSLNDLVYVIAQLDLLITNDSGPMHIGAATGTPLVALFGPEDPKIFHPYTSPDKYIVIYKQLDCQPCNKKKCRNHACLNTISVNDVLEAAHDLLSMSK